MFAAAPATGSGKRAIRDPDFGHFEWGGSTGAADGGRKPASIRFNNPGAQYPADWAKAFAIDGYSVIGGGAWLSPLPSTGAFIGSGRVPTHNANPDHAQIQVFRSAQMIS
jgi:hypothetical protein